jgi:hypothetical protein
MSNRTLTLISSVVAGFFVLFCIIALLLAEDKGTGFIYNQDGTFSAGFIYLMIFMIMMMLGCIFTALSYFKNNYMFLLIGTLFYIISSLPILFYTMNLNMLIPNFYIFTVYSAIPLFINVINIFFINHFRKK